MKHFSLWKTHKVNIGGISKEKSQTGIIQKEISAKESSALKEEQRKNCFYMIYVIFTFLIVFFVCFLRQTICFCSFQFSNFPGGKIWKWMDFLLLFFALTDWFSWYRVISSWICIFLLCGIQKTMTLIASRRFNFDLMNFLLFGARGFNEISNKRILPDIN